MIFDFFKTLSRNYPLLYDGLIILGALLVCAASHFIVKKILVRGLKQLFPLLRSQENTANALVIKIARRIAYIVPVVIFFHVPAFFPEINDRLELFIQHVSIVFLSIFITGSFMLILDLVNFCYERQPNAESRPVKGYLQLGKILIIIVAVILTVSFILGKSPVLLLSGLGAVAAVLMLIFQDTILSLVASIQINSNNMLKIGDWIEMPAYGADGFVIEIALHTVKIQNWDKTIVTVPMRKLVEGSFTNWRGMFESGGRRIKRSLHIDQRSIRFLTDEEVKRLEEFVLLNDYLQEKHKEISAWNAELAARGATPINGRRITNIGTFRIYVEQYLRSNPAIHQEMLMLVRQLAPGSKGLPLEIYCFTQSTKWVDYEKAQADIFDHLLAILPVFGLRVFQEISDVPDLSGGLGSDGKLFTPSDCKGTADS